MDFTLVRKSISNFINYHVTNHLCQTSQHFQNETKFFEIFLCTVSPLGDFSCLDSALKFELKTPELPGKISGKICHLNFYRYIDYDRPILF